MRRRNPPTQSSRPLANGRKDCKTRERHDELHATIYESLLATAIPYIRPASKNSRRSRQGKTTASTKILHGLT
jgi:hypothetical protein